MAIFYRIERQDKYLKFIGRSIFPKKRSIFFSDFSSSFLSIRFDMLYVYCVASKPKLCLACFFLKFLKVQVA